MPLNKSELAIRISPELLKAIGAQTLSQKLETSKVLALAAGTGAGQADRFYYAKPSIAGSATLTLDLNGGGLVDPYGDALAFARIKKLIVFNELGPNTINVVRPASNGVPLFLAAGDGEPVHVGGITIKYWPGATAIVVTAGTGDLIDIVNTAAGAVTPEIWIEGASA